MGENSTVLDTSLFQLYYYAKNNTMRRNLSLFTVTKLFLGYFLVGICSGSGLEHGLHSDLV